MRQVIFHCRVINACGLARLCQESVRQYRTNKYEQGAYVLRVLMYVVCAYVEYMFVYRH